MRSGLGKGVRVADNIDNRAGNALRMKHTCQKFTILLVLLFSLLHQQYHHGQVIIDQALLARISPVWN
jgi:hypothetical protein